MSGQRLAREDPAGPFLAAAVARVRAAGGQAEEPVPRAYGLSADCVDTDGVPFALHQPSAESGCGKPLPAPTGCRPSGRRSHPA